MNYRKITTKELRIEKEQPLLDKLLSIRGIEDKKDIQKFLNPSKEDFISPFVFCDMKKSCARIKEAIEKQQKILVWGDFDCDGVTSSAILYKTLKELNADFLTYIPDRLTEGHGLNSNKLLSYTAKEHIKLVITVDCGISNIKEIALLKNFGVDVIITDHHTTDIELPCAYAIINPQVMGALDSKLSTEEIEALTYNSGSIVAYKLAMALLKDIKNDDLKEELLTVASCGAIADVVPLRFENRAIVTEGLKLLNAKKEKTNLGIYKLLSQNIEGRDINSTDIAFILAPRINAIGRLANAELSFNFLCEKDEEKLGIYIEKMEYFNAIRQKMCSDTFNEVVKTLEENPEEAKKPAIILLNNSWHIGVIGIVAAKVVEKYHKPCFLMSVDENKNARCSIRSNDLINVYQILKENEELLLGFGGHKLAGGCSFEAKNFENVKEALLKSIQEMIGDRRPDTKLYADIEIKSEEITPEIFDTINKLEPFGQNNEAPVFAMFNINLDDYNTMGKDQNHLKFTFSDGKYKFQGVKWSETEVLIPKNTKCDIAFYPRLNNFNGVQSVQFEIIDMYSPAVKNLYKTFKIFDHRQKTDILEQVASYFERDGLDIGVWAKTVSVKEMLSKYGKIKDNFMPEAQEHNDIMIFDYPNSISEFQKLIYRSKPAKIHLMNYKIDENMENYIKQVMGMIKYSTNHLQGGIDVIRLAQNLGMSENFAQTALEILENIGSIEIIDVNKVKYIKPCVYSDFQQDSMFEGLREDFLKTIEFKKTIYNYSVKEFEQILDI